MNRSTVSRRGLCSSMGCCHLMGFAATELSSPLLWRESPGQSCCCCRVVDATIMEEETVIRSEPRRR
ncbi:hypothetical protein ACLOJK_022633 [Asimina triloba]